MIDAELFREVITYVPDGKRIQERRIKLGMILREVCEKVGITPAFLSDIEHGRRSCSLEVAHRLSEALRRR